MLQQILQEFCLDSPAVSWEPYGFGHINRTYLAVTRSGRRYIMQRINRHVFRDVPGLMENIRLVTAHLAKRSEPGTVLNLVPTVTGSVYLERDGEYWRVYDFVEGTECLQQARTEADFYQCALGFGRFQQALADFPAELLCETIPDFHNTPKRYERFLEVLSRDSLNLAGTVTREIEFALERQGEMRLLQTLRQTGELPTRVTHNDTKLNNVLLDAVTGEARCVIDLDTVMPGLHLYDFGDAIRFGAATAAEDEKDLSRVAVDPARFRVYTRGSLAACPSLTEREIGLMPQGAKTMTMECGLRFLTDYLEGDVYFATHYSGQNLDRCRTQFKLVADMEDKWDMLHRIVREERAGT